VHVEQHQVGLEGLQRGEPEAPVLGHAHLEALAGEEMLHQLADLGLVVDHEDLLRRHGR
jgi:hypothetical protein